MAVELEQRWNHALRLVPQRQAELDAWQGPDPLPTEEQRHALLALAKDLPTVWQHPASSPEIKKRLLRAVLKELIVFLIDPRIRLVLHWQGGDHTELEILKNRPGLHRWKTEVDVEEMVRALARLMPDAHIAALLHRAGKRTAKGLAWTRNRVCSVRNDHQLTVYVEGERQARREVTRTEAAEQLGVSTMTVRRLIKRGRLSATQVGVGAPWVIPQDELTLPVVQKALRDSPRTADDKQTVLDFQ